jgi:hypothetical protein
MSGYMNARFVGRPYSDTYGVYAEDSCGVTRRIGAVTRKSGRRWEAWTYDGVTTVHRTRAEAGGAVLDRADARLVRP